MKRDVIVKKRRPSRIAASACRSGILHLMLLAGAIVFSLPFLWLVVTSFKGHEEIFRVPPTWIPEVFSERPIVASNLFQNFVRAAEWIPFWKWMGNTFYVSALSVILNVISSSFIAFSFAQIRWRGREAVFILVLATNGLGWYNTLQPLWFATLFGSAFHIFLLRQFMLTLPQELVDAAKIDGCSYVGIWSRITLPLIKPALAVVAVQTFQNSWNNFLGPYIYINTKDKMTIALGLQWFQSEHGNMYGEMMATALVMTIPVILLFFFCQRYMVRGISLTGIKG